MNRTNTTEWKKLQRKKVRQRNTADQWQGRIQNKSSAGLEETTALMRDRSILEFDGYAEVKEICRPGNHFLKNPPNRYPGRTM